MGIGAFTGYIDLAQVVLYLFWLFFAGLIYYLRREDKREGYPLESERSQHVTVQGFPPVPAPKTFRLHDGTTRQAPAGAPAPASGSPPLRGNPIAIPAGVDLLLAGIGPGAYTERPDVPDNTAEGEPKIVPLRAAAGFAVAERDPDPRDMEVIGADGRSAGKVTDLWIDKAEPQIRYFEIAAAGGARRVLVPAGFVRVDAGQRRLRVRALLAAQFANIPATAQDDRVTMREEDRICGYFAAGTLYAEPSRAEPLI